MGTQVLDLRKDQVLDLTKEIATISTLRCGIGWQGNRGQDVDLDSYAIIYMKDGRSGMVDFTNYSKERIRSNGVTHHGDDLVGGGRADDPNEVIDINVPGLPGEVDRIELGVSIYSGASTLHEVKNAFINVTDMTSGREICRFKMEDFSQYANILAGELKPNGQFKAIGQANMTRMSALMTQHRKAQDLFTSNGNAQPAPQQQKKSFWSRLFS